MVLVEEERFRGLHGNKSWGDRARHQIATLGEKSVERPRTTNGKNKTRTGIKIRLDEGKGKDFGSLVGRASPNGSEESLRMAHDSSEDARWVLRRQVCAGLGW
jgi:hypothetical protein